MRSHALGCPGKVTVPPFRGHLIEINDRCRLQDGRAKVSSSHVFDASWETPTNS